MRTLYEDWTLRRERLSHADEEPGMFDCLRVLDYLLIRYRDDPAGRRPARFPMPTHVFLNSRGIVVHHHLGRGSVYGTKSEHEAHTRAKRILSRIAAVDPQASVGPPGSGGGSLNLHDASAFAFFSKEKPGWEWIGRAISLDEQPMVLHFCKKALAVRPVLPEEAVKYLTREKVFSAESLELLEHCENQSLLDFCLQKYLNPYDVQPDWFMRRVEAFFIRQKTRASETARGFLADPNPKIRSRAAELLGKIGDLNDIGLLQDLLSLPEMKENHLERSAYTWALQALSGSPVTRPDRTA